MSKALWNMRTPFITLSVVASILTVAVATIEVQAQVNAVYVSSNIGTVPNSNTVLGYSNDGTGNLTPLPGSPYLTGGRGVAPAPGTPLGLQTDDDQEVIINKAGTVLYTVNGNSNTVSAFAINSDLSLTPLSGSPYASFGSQPASLGLLDDALPGGVGMMAVVNHATDANQPPAQPNVTTFTVNPDGTLTHNTAPGATVTLPVADAPSQATFGKAHLLFVMEFAGAIGPSQSRIDSFRIHQDGSLSLVNFVPPPTGEMVFLGQVHHPIKSIVYAALPADNQIAVYHYNVKSGILTFVTQVANPGELPCWLETSADGSKLYTAETMSNTLTVYDTTDPAAPVQLQHVTLATTSSGAGATNLHLDPTGKFLYVLSNSSTDSGLHVLNVASDGTLTETLSPLILPVPSGNFPIGLAVLLK